MILLFSLLDTSQTIITVPTAIVIVRSQSPTIQPGQVILTTDIARQKISVVSPTMSVGSVSLAPNAGRITLLPSNFTIPETVDIAVFTVRVQSPIIQGGDILFAPQIPRVTVLVGNVLLQGSGQTTLGIDVANQRIISISPQVVVGDVALTPTSSRLVILSSNTTIVGDVITIGPDVPVFNIFTGSLALTTQTNITTDIAKISLIISPASIVSTASLAGITPRFTVKTIDPNLFGGLGILVPDDVKITLIPGTAELVVPVIPILPGSWIVNLNASLYLALTDYLVSLEYAINDPSKPQNVNVLLAFPDDLTKITDRTIAIENIPTFSNMTDNQIGTSGWDYEMNVKYDIYAKTDRDIDQLLFEVSEHLKDSVTYYDWDTVLKHGFAAGNTGLLIDFENLSTGRVRDKTLRTQELLKHVGFVRFKTSIASDNLL